MNLQRILLAFVVAGAPALFAQTTTTTATTTRTFTFPPTGLGSSETAQINVVNTAAASSSGTAASCVGSISFENASGAVIGTATSFTAGTGVITSVTLPFAKAGVVGTRTEVRGVVLQTFATATGTTRPPCSLTVSMETYDTTTGATHTFQSGEGASSNLGGQGH